MPYRCLILIGLWLAQGIALAQPDPFPQVATSYLVKVQDKVLWERQAARKLPPASLTKLMMALLVLENYQPRQVVEIGRQAAAETGMLLGVKVGQRFYLEDLLAAALISSDNDACHALADYIAGDQVKFVQAMNERAAKLGMHDTHFTNACGHDAPDHYSTANDLALLAEEILHHPEITSIVSRAEVKITTVDSGQSYLLHTRNALLGRYTGTLGLKTGYTPRAGKCLIAYVERNGTHVLLVMLHGNDRWWDAADILDIAFAQAKQSN